ncbi:S-layer-like y domain-containing protein [Paenibacillus endophyticus]
MKRTLTGFLVVALFLSILGGSGWFSVANAADADASVRFEETDLGWDDHAFTFPNGGAIRNVSQLESSSEDDLFAIAQLPYGDKWDIFHFDTDGTYHGALVDRTTLEQDLIDAGATWLSGGFDFKPEKIVFSSESGVDYLYIIHNQNDTNYPMIKYNLNTKSITNPEVVIFTQPVTSIQKAFDGLLYASTRETNIYYTIDPSAPAISPQTTSWGFEINSIVKLQNGKFMASNYFYPDKGYICDTSCNPLAGSENYFSEIGASPDGTQVVGVGSSDSFNSMVYVNESQAIELDGYARYVEINNQGTIFVGSYYQHPIQVIEYNASTNKYEVVGTIGTSRETTYDNNSYSFVQDEKGHVFILDSSNGTIDEFDELGLYVRSKHFDGSLYQFTYYNGLLYAADDDNGRVVAISTADLSYVDTLWNDAVSVLATPGGTLLVARENQLEQYAIDPLNNTRTLIHTYPFTGYNLTMQSDDRVSITMGMTYNVRFINYKTFETEDNDWTSWYSSWFDPSGLIAVNTGKYWSIVDPATSSTLYTSSDRNYGSSSFYKGNGQRMVLKTFFDSSLRTVRTIPVGITIAAPSLSDTPAFLTNEEELEQIAGNLVTSNSINLGIDFPMNGVIVNELTLNGDELLFNGVRETKLELKSMPSTIYQAVIGDIGKRKAILQFNNLDNDWNSGTLQMIFSEETGEIQIQVDKNQGNSNTMEDLILWEVDYFNSGATGSHLSVGTGDVVKLFPYRTYFNVSQGAKYEPIFLSSASSPVEPVLQSPAFGTRFYPDSPEVIFEWDNSNVPGSYDQTRLLLSTDPSYRNVIRTVILTNEESYAMDTSELYAGIPYYWKVIVADTANTAYAYSTNGAFSINNWSVSLELDNADVTANSAQAIYEIMSSDRDQYTKSGIALSTSMNPTVSNSVYSTETHPTGEQHIALTELLPSTTYHARAYAVTDQTTRYSSNITFTTGAGPTTPPTTPPTPSTPPPVVGPGPDLPEAACPFTDLENHWSKSNICEAASLAIVEGMDVNRFAPNMEITRAEFAVMLARVLQVTAIEGEASPSFRDEESIPAWARPMVQAALAEGIINGYPDGTFRPQQTITRIEMAAMLSKAMKWESSGEQELSFADLASIPAWAMPYVTIVSERGLVQGRGDHLFVPRGKTTRAEAGVLLLRLWHILH